jgi:peptide/nickel transport system permease protein
MLAGLILILFLFFFWLAGCAFVDTKRAQPISGLPDQRPSYQYLLGTDSNGRDIFAVMIVGTGLTLRVGFLAGIMGLGIAVILGFMSGFYGGVLDTIIKGIVDVLLTVPPLAVLVVIAAMRAEAITLNFMIILVASLSWMLPTRTIRSQVLSLRERAYISMARLSGMTGTEIIVKEIMPTLIPFLAAGFVSISSTAVLASIGLEALGLGPQSLPTLGMAIYWAISFSAMLRGMWWWWAPPVVVIIILFVGLFLIASGLDLVANPKLRRLR